MWAARELGATIRWLGRFGYRCFFQGRASDANAAVLAVNAARIERCATDIAAVLQANLVCAQRPELVARLRGLRLRERTAASTEEDERSD